MECGWNVKVYFTLLNHLSKPRMAGKVIEKMINDKIDWKSEWSIYRFRDPDGKIADMLKNGASIQDVIIFAGNCYIGAEFFEDNVALNEGLGELIDIICGLGTPTKWDSTNARLGVGDSNAAENATQTGLQAATNKTWKAMDSGYPSRSNQTVEWRATFGSTEANYAWEEYTVVNAADDSGKNLNRKISSKGTKVSGESWVLSLKITFS